MVTFFMLYEYVHMGGWLASVRGGVSFHESASYRVLALFGEEIWITEQTNID
jgi:hypothetical protein